MSVRSRNIKSDFFKDEKMADLSFQSRLLFIGLWCLSDREGRFEWSVRRIKVEVFPYDEIDINHELAALQRLDLIFKYKVDGKLFGEVVNFKRHQNPHPHEAKSKIPQPKKDVIFQCHDIDNTLHVMSPKCTADSLILKPSDSLIPDSLITPNQTKELSDIETTVADAPIDSVDDEPRIVYDTDLLPKVKKKSPHIAAAPPLFDEWYKAYPRREGRGAAMKAYAKAIRKASAEEILAGLNRSVANWEAKGTEKQYIPLPATWLNAERWADDLQQAPAVLDDRIRLQRQADQIKKQMGLA